MDAHRLASSYWGLLLAVAITAVLQTVLVVRSPAITADGIIFAAPSFCDPALLDQPRLTKALGDAQVPYTAFKYAENTGQFQSIREQAGTFADSVKLWGHA